MKSKLNLILILLLLPALLFAQDGKGKQGKKSKTEKRTNYQEQEEWEEPDSVRKFEFGLNFGAYFANKFSANYYNGTPGNTNKVSYVMSNKYWYQDIKRALNASDTVLVQRDIYTGTDGYPRNMHYNVAFSGGLYLRMNFDRKNSIFLEANYAGLKASDMLVMEVDPPNYLTMPDLRYLPIEGKEGRVMIDLGYQRNFPMKSKIYFFVQAAATMCYTQVRESYFVVEGTKYSIINIYGDQIYVPNTNQQTQNIYQNAFGFGGMIGLGAGLPLTDMFGLEPGFTMQYYPTNLSGYTGFKPSFGINLRIMMAFTQQE